MKLYIGHQDIIVWLIRVVIQVIQSEELFISYWFEKKKKCNVLVYPFSLNAFKVTLEWHILTFSIFFSLDVFVLKCHLNQAL